MKIFTRERIIILFIFVLLIPLFTMFIFHDLYMGTDEIRTTYVAKEIAKRGQVYFKDDNNTRYNTNIFVKNAFLINNSNVIYPAGFTINSLILVPVLSLTQDPIETFNLFALICFLFSFLILYKIFVALGLPYYLSIVGSLLFVMTNFYLALYVSYYPDFLLIFISLIFIYVIIRFHKTDNKNYFLIIQIISAFLLAYKITMYPIIFIFLPLYFIYLLKTKRINYKLACLAFALFLISFSIFNIPQLITNKVGPTYNELATGNNTSKKGPIQKTNFLSTVEHLGTKFYYDFLLPKGNGIYLEEHFIKDFKFLGSNNIIYLFGFLFSSIFLFKFNKKIFYMLLLLYLCSFMLWGNMNAYGGGGVYDLGDLRNTHIRYMFPILILLYIVGFYYLIKVLENRYIIVGLLSYIIVTSMISLTIDYPFSSYSLINANGFFYNFDKEKNEITNLNLPQNAIFISTVFDDYDLSYYFTNYADFKRLSGKSKEMRTLLSHFTKDKERKVYLLYPLSDSRFNPIGQKDLDSLYSYIQTNYHSRVIYSDDYKQLISISKG